MLTRTRPQGHDQIVALVEPPDGTTRGRPSARRVAGLIAVPLIVIGAGTLAGVNAPPPTTAADEAIVAPTVDPEPLFVRATPGGIRLGVHVDPTVGTGFVRADVASPNAVGWAGAPLSAPLSAGIEVRNAGVLGAAEGAPVSWVVVQVAPDAAVVLLENGVRLDEMVPVDGWAVLVGSGALREGRVVAKATDGTTVGESDVVWPAAGAPTLDLAFSRMTADHVQVMLYLGATQVVPELAHASIVAVPGNGLLTPGPAPDEACPLRVRGAYAFGRGAGWPAGAVVLRAGDDVAAVRALFDDGWVDEMPPAEGWAVLARTGTVEEWTIEAVDAGGEIVATVSGRPDDPCRS